MPFALRKTLMKYMSQPPAFTVIRVNTLKISVEEVIQDLEKYLIKTGTSYDSIFCFQQYEEKQCLVPKVSKHSIINDIIVVQSCGLLKNCVPCEQEVIVDLQCGMAVLRGADVYVPGIMATSSSMQKDDKVAVYADLHRLCRKGQKQEFNGQKLFVGNGRTNISRIELFKNSGMSRGIGIKLIEPAFDCPSLGDFNPSLIFLQNLPSVVCGHVLDPQPGQTILDMCAAPGGKTVHIATLMKNQGTVIALDRSKPKIRKIEENAKKFSISCVKSFLFDSTKALSDMEFINDDFSPPYPPKTFDKILLDAPCSCLGQRPLIVVSKADVKSYKALQLKLFKTAVALLKDGGTIVYSTCSLTLSENEENVAEMLDRFPSMSLVSQTPYLGFPGLKVEGLSEDQLKLMQRFDYLSNYNNEELSVDTDTIGFFIAKFQKNKCLK
ncbi:putative methyltransferase NSUN6 [Nymphon striatum]|nr:putative methyltransferase NSUN6 [Nymphon striatum]